jgi:hypothetical protein
METSRVNLTGLAVALAAGLLILHLPESQGILASLAGLTLLVALFAFGQDIARTSAQSLAFALVCGLAALGAVSFPIRIVIGTGKTVLGQDAIPPVVWLLATAIFWFIDRSGAEPSAVQPVHLHGGTYSQPPMPVEVPKAQPYTPAPVSFVSPLPPVPEPLRTPDPEPMPVAPPPPPPAPVTGSTVAAAPPIPSGKEVNIYVTMVGEGMNVLRSVRAEHLGRDFYIIVDEMPADENWQFVPGQVVRCRKKSLSNGKGMVAYEEAPRAQ